MRIATMQRLLSVVLLFAVAPAVRAQDCTGLASKSGPADRSATRTVSRSLDDFRTLAASGLPVGARTEECAPGVRSRILASPAASSQTKRLEGMLAQMFDGSVWSDYARITFEYDTADRPVSSVTEFWDPAESEWVPTSRDLTSYDENGVETSTLSEYWDNGSWVSVDRTTHLFDGGGQHVGSETESWNGAAWTPVERVTWTLSASGLPVDIESYYHDSVDWVLFSVEHYEYDTEDREIEWTYTESFPGGLSQRHITAYGQDGTIEQVSQILVGEDWVDQYRSVTTFDGAGRPTEQLVQASNSVGGWEDLYLDLYTYNDLDGWARTESFTMEGMAWVPGTADTTFLDAEGDQVEVVFQSWDDDAEDWVDYYRILFLYGSSIAAEDESPLPSGLEIDVYPSPAAHDVNILVSRADSGPLRVEVFDLLGRRLATLADRQEPAGTSALRWSTDGLPGGVYLVRLSNGARVTSKPVVVAGQ
jgi:hypothetical protein